ncbi:MAG: hypothetical protein QI197_08100 [Candidatus Korarchaeota archaeon]|nr:hypothetical protein [Candidatus Korarchaeota archaeon]
MRKSGGSDQENVAKVIHSILLDERISCRSARGQHLGRERIFKKFKEDRAVSLEFSWKTFNKVLRRALRRPVHF